MSAQLQLGKPRRCGYAGRRHLEEMPMPAITPEGENWQAQLKRDGYALFPKLCPQVLVEAARAAIDQDLAENFEPKRQIEYDHRSYCPGLRSSAPLMALLFDSGIVAKLDAVLGFERLDCNPAQIALRKRGVARRRARLKPHIDGLSTRFNGVPADLPVTNFTALVGVFLSPARSDYAGNFTVWPGSHLVLERYFREHGVEGLRRGMPDIPLGAPVQLMSEPGDVLLCHYQLAHSWAVNLSDTDRYAIYFRLRFKDIAERRFEFMTDIWRGWRI
jgi:hypothetical protein